MEHVRLYIADDVAYATDNVNRVLDNKDLVLVDGSTGLYSRKILPLGVSLLKKKIVLLKPFITECDHIASLPVVREIKLVSENIFRQVFDSYLEELKKYDTEITTLRMDTEERLRTETSRFSFDSVAQYNNSVASLRSETERILADKMKELIKPALEDILLMQV